MTKRVSLRRHVLVKSATMAIPRSEGAQPCPRAKGSWSPVGCFGRGPGIAEETRHHAEAQGCLSVATHGCLVHTRLKQPGPAKLS